MEVYRICSQTREILTKIPAEITILLEIIISSKMRVMIL